MMSEVSIAQAHRDLAGEIVRCGAPGVGNGNQVVASDIKGGLHDDYHIVKLIAAAFPTPPSVNREDGEARARLKYYPDYIDDPDGLERFRQAVLTNPGHDMAAVNHNSLGRLIDTIERLRRERDASLSVSPVAADRANDEQRAAHWTPRVGEEVRTTDAVHEKYGEWRNVRLWVAEVRAERGRNDRLNITVTEEWPMGRQATLTDAFYIGGDAPDDLQPAFASPVAGGEVERKLPSRETLAAAIYNATPDRFIRLSQCYPAANAIRAALASPGDRT